MFFLSILFYLLNLMNLKKNNLMWNFCFVSVFSEHNSWEPEAHILSKTPIKLFWRKMKKTSKELNLQIARRAERQSNESDSYFLP